MVASSVAMFAVVAFQRAGTRPVRVEGRVAGRWEVIKLSSKFDKSFDEECHQARASRFTRAVRHLVVEEIFLEMLGMSLTIRT